MPNDEHARQGDDLLRRWLADELSTDELEQLRKRWDFAELELLVLQLKQPPDPYFDEEKARTELIEKLSDRPTAEAEEEEFPNILLPTPPATENSTPPETQASTPWERYVVIGAVMLVLGVLAWLLLCSEEHPVTHEVSTGPGEKKELKLPDGSQVTMNASTTLGYSPDHWKERSYVVLSGEAYFKTKKGRRFTVHTRQGDVVVVGTQFNVYAREKELEVKCLEGKVQVINPKGTERVLLKQKEQVSVINGRMQKRQGLAFYPTWQKGESSFRDAPLEKVLTDLRAQYGLVIVADSLGHRSFSGKFVHNDLQKAVKMICQPLQLHCTLRADTLRIDSR